jgi:hypothetical protein
MKLRKIVSKLTNPIFIPLRKLFVFTDKKIGTCDYRLALVHRETANHFFNCWHCGGEVIWGGDDEFEAYGIAAEGIVSNFSCTLCRATYECFLPLDEDSA